jgi:hypothetical protein
MEQVWEELKKIEAEAENIRIGALQKVQSIKVFAEQSSEKLIDNSQVYAEEEGKNLYSKAVEEANNKRSEQLKINQAAIEKLKVQAAKSMEPAIDKVVNSILSGS